MKLSPPPPGEGWSPGTGERQGDTERLTFRRLPSSAREARAIAALIPPKQRLLALDFDASRARALSPELAQYRDLHFATHGELDSRRPELSKLVLSLFDEKGRPEDGFLRLNDIYNLHLDADLVVLSACRTALGQEIRGEGLVGLTRGFMYAGAARVLASLWSVEDRATADLMESFYRERLRQGLSPAAALRRAQLEMARQPGRRSLPIPGPASPSRVSGGEPARARGMTPEEFEALLAQLDPDRERAGERYETIRRKLVRLFEWRGCAARRIWRTRR